VGGVEMRKFVALTKLHRGGEFLPACLEGIHANTDALVAVFSDSPWRADLKYGQENCTGSLHEFINAHPDYRVLELHGNYPSEHTQYVAGLEAIKREWGVDAGVMIVDSDEIWNPCDVATLRARVEKFPNVEYYRSGIYAYLRSPLWRVYPREPHHATVALRTPHHPQFTGRFADNKPNLYFEDLSFHHYTYVRADQNEIPAKWHATDSQENSKGDPRWLETTWNQLPRGKNLHYCIGFAHCWQEIEVLSELAMPASVAALPFIRDIIKRE
jgi:hypothetical protein